MGKFNFGRKHISLLISCVAISGIVISSTVYAGYSKWIFKDTATYEHENTHYEVDPIRENATFYDGYDAVDEGTKYYDVYFMAQSYPDTIPNKKMLTDNGDGTHSFTDEFLKHPYYYVDTNSGDDINSADFGHFSGADCDTTNYSFDIDKNYWFTRLENISEISVSAYDDVVKRIENNLIDRNGYRLKFLGWSLSPLEIYATKDYLWPSSFSSGTVQGEDNKKTTLVTGFYPYSDDFTPFYMNTSLDFYKDNVKNIDGKPTLFLYPVFSSGKNYYGYDYLDKNVTTKDSITITKSYLNSSQNQTYIPYFNGFLKKELTSDDYKISDIEVYSLDNFVITQSEISKGLNSISIQNNINSKSSGYAWPDLRQFPSYSHVVEDEYGNSLNLLNLSTVSNLKSGRYNVYLFVKTAEADGYIDVPSADEKAITVDDKRTINKMMEDNNRIRYSSLDGEEYRADCHYFLWPYYDYRDYYVYFERIYEPRIIGGPTLDLNYDSELSNSLQFLRKGSSGKDNNRYQIRGVELQGDNWIEYPLGDGKTLLFKDYYFGVMLNPEVSFTSYGFDLINDEGYTNDQYQTDGFPSVTYQDQNGVDKTEYYKSGAIFEKYNPDDKTHDDVKIRDDITGDETKYKGNQFVLIKPKNIDTTGKGIYNIVIDIKYDQNSNGHDTNLIVPTSVTFYGYKLSNLFVNIMETDENGEVEMGHTQGGTHYEHFVNTDVYEYTRSNYYELANVTLDDVFTAKDWSTKTLREILTELKAGGKCLEDLVTSRYITLENLDPDNENYIPFTIQKNYVFKIVSIPAELQ